MAKIILTWEKLHYLRTYIKWELIVVKILTCYRIIEFHFAVCIIEFHFAVIRVVSTYDMVAIKNKAKVLKKWALVKAANRNFDV